MRDLASVGRPDARRTGWDKIGIACRGRARGAGERHRDHRHPSAATGVGSKAKDLQRLPKLCPVRVAWRKARFCRDLQNFFLKHVQPKRGYLGSGSASHEVLITEATPAAANIDSVSAVDAIHQASP
ncbi:hypothetical protein D3C87_1258390 [compost metagenome]